MSIKVTLDRIEPQPDESYWVTVQFRDLEPRPVDVLLNVWLSFGVPKKYKDMDEIKNYALDQAKTELQRCIDAL